MKRRLFLIMLMIAGVLIFPAKYYAADSQAEELKLLLGEAKMLSVDGPKRIVIGNPNILDVMNVTSSEITLSPKAAGSTTLVIWDKFGELSYKIKVFAEDIEPIKGRVDNILADLNIPAVYSKADEDEGKVVIMGSVKNVSDKEKITNALTTLKEKIMDLVEVKEEEAIVEIDVQLLELDRDATNTLGFSWPGAIGVTEVGSPGISDTGAKFSNLFKVVNFQRAAFIWSIDALVQEGKARILSRPKLACQSGKEAELLVGGEKPTLTSQVVSGTSGSNSTTVDYKEFGIKLKIKPVVREDRRIKLSLKMEVSEVGDAVVLGLVSQPTALAYPLTKRNASTELILDDQQTLAIGGLIKRKNEEDIRKTPFLSDLPILGVLFRRKQTKIGDGAGNRGETELFITLTPTIVSGKESKVTLAKQENKNTENTSLAAASDLPPELVGYSQVIQKRILQNVNYPPAAKDAGFQGTVKLSLHLSYKGELMDALVKDSSGYKIIDDNAIAVVKGISAYPPFPPSIVSKDLWIDIPIEYRLN